MELHFYWISAITYAIVLSIILFSDIKATNRPESLEKSYREMSTWVIFFCLQDAIWGLCEANVIVNDTIYFISSSIFHISTVVTTYFWLKYVLEYLGERIKHRKIFLLLDIFVICFELILVVINFFKTTLFYIIDGIYITGPFRPLTFVNQYVVYLTIGISTLVFMLKKDSKENAHYRTVFLFTLAPIILGLLQLLFPDAPFYSLGYFIGCFILHIFVVASDREVYLSKEEKVRKIIELNNALEKKQTEIDEQFDILKSICGVFDYINLLDFEINTVLRIDVLDATEESFDFLNDPHILLDKKIATYVDAEDYDKFWKYTNLSTLEGRMRGKKHLSTELKYADGKWIRAMYIRIGDDLEEPLSRVAYALRDITVDRKREAQVYSAMTNLFYSLYIFNLTNDTMERLIEPDFIKQIAGNEDSAQKMSNTIARTICKDEFLDEILDFFDLSTVSKRMEGKKTLSCEFMGKYHGWTRVTFIPIEMKNNQILKMAIFTQIIDSEKNKMLSLIYKSSTDELTGLYNRRMYDEELEALAASDNIDDLVIIAMDVNGLKIVNDSLGHKAGDELISGAGKCIDEAFASLGKVFRTGGDEFMIILRCDIKKLPDILGQFDKKVKDWSGCSVEKCSISYGYAAVSDYPKLTIKELASIADKRMYEAKYEYYKKNGIDRRRT